MENLAKYGNNLPAKKVQEELVIHLTKASMIAGVSIGVEMLLVMSEEVGRILSTFPQISLEELPEILRAGVIGDYGESYLCVRNINSWLKQYNALKSRKKAIEDSKAQEVDKIPAQARVGFFMQNLDKLPSLKAYLHREEENKPII